MNKSHLTTKGNVEWKEQRIKTKGKFLYVKNWNWRSKTLSSGPPLILSNCSSLSSLPLRLSFEPTNYPWDYEEENTWIHGNILIIWVRWAKLNTFTVFCLDSYNRCLWGKEMILMWKFRLVVQVTKRITTDVEFVLNSNYRNKYLENAIYKPEKATFVKFSTLNLLVIWFGKSTDIGDLSALEATTTK